MNEKKFFQITATILLINKKNNSISRGGRYYIQTGIVIAKSATSAINKAKELLIRKFGYKPYNYERTIYIKKSGIEVGGWTDFNAKEIKPLPVFKNWQELIDFEYPRHSKNSATFAKRVEDYFVEHWCDNFIARVPSDCDHPVIINGEIAITPDNLYLAIPSYIF